MDFLQNMTRVGISVLFGLFIHLQEDHGLARGMNAKIAYVFCCGDVPWDISWGILCLSRRIRPFLEKLDRYPTNKFYSGVYFLGPWL